MRVFSFCLYNPYNPFYYSTLLDNIDVIHKYFPGWDIIVYIGNDVPSWYQEKLNSLGCHLRQTGLHGAYNMVQRFFAIDETDVEIMIVRDADSPIHWKDRWAIQKFLESSYQFHTIRDNPEHQAAIMGGLWAMRKQPGLSIRTLYETYKADAHEFSGRNNDQHFLRRCLYPIARLTMLVHYSHNSVLHAFEHAVKFPFEWTNTLYCGKN